MSHNQTTDSVACLVTARHLIEENYDSIDKVLNENDAERKRNSIHVFKSPTYGILSVLYITFTYMVCNRLQKKRDA